MTTSETYIPRPVVMYFFVAPSQKMVRWNYASIRDAKKVWHATRLQAAASVPLQPWTSSVHWRYSEEAPRAVYAVEPMNKPVLRYQGGDVVPLNLLGHASYPMVGGRISAQTDKRGRVVERMLILGNQPACRQPRQTRFVHVLNLPLAIVFPNAIRFLTKLEHSPS